MVFNSAAFLVFILLAFPAYWWINNKAGIKLRNILVIALSYLFYGYWDYRFLGLIIISSAFDFFIGKWMHAAQNRLRRRTFLVSSLIINLGILGFFKYYNFFVESFMLLFNLPEANANTLSIILPVGISFYTFQTLSYTIDIYRKRIEPTRDMAAFFAFVSFFPQLVAGPIERASHLLPQFYTRKKFDYSYALGGLRLMLWGFFKKLVIADNFGLLANTFLNPQYQDNGLMVILGSICFGVQIYADFSAYSEIAIGLSRLLGFDLMKNFKAPYFARSFSDFWNRWHISLSTWFRDYLYIPLGGNRKSKFRNLLNLWITFLVSGLWHGANFTFLIWGALHAFMLSIEKLIIGKRQSLLFTPVVFAFVMLFWLAFRAENIQHLAAMAQALVNTNSYQLFSADILPSNLPQNLLWALLPASALLVYVDSRLRGKDFNEWIQPRANWIRISLYYFLIAAILFLGNYSVKPDFIYFQF